VALRQVHGAFAPACIESPGWAGGAGKELASSLHGDSIEQAAAHADTCRPQRPRAARAAPARATDRGMRRAAGTLAACGAGRPGTRIVPHRRTIFGRPGPARGDGGAERAEAPAPAFPWPLHGAAGTTLRRHRPARG